MSSEGQLPLFGTSAVPSAAARADLEGSVRPAAAPPPPSDQDARAFATDPRHNVVLEASAGTGKTSVLVARYLSLLRAGVNPANILAITFTRKAAAEMRERIVHELRAAAERSPADRARWSELRDRLGEIAISTIDAFCLSLLREFPLEADLDPGFGMADETEVPRLIDQALDRALRICGSLSREDPDVAIVLAHLGVSRARSGLEHLLHQRLVASAALERFLGSGPADLDGDAVCHRALERLRDLLGSVPGGLGQFLDDGPVDHPRFAMLAYDLRRLDELRHARSSAIRSVIDRIRDHFLTQAGEPRTKFKAYNASHCVSPAAWKRHRAAVASLAPKVTDRIVAFHRDLNFVFVRGVRRMFAIAVSEYQRTLQSRAVVDFSDVLERALHLLRQMDEFAQSRYRLESRYHHVLVDELQDTSRAQWELVALLIQSWGEGFGLVHDAPLQPSVFVVGDRKQSIYRFRDAEVAVLHEASAYIETLRPGADVWRSISHSFRAVPGLLQFVNDVFTAVDKAPARRDAFRYEAPDRFPVDQEPEASLRSDEEMRRSGVDIPPALGIAVADEPDRCAVAVAAEVDRLIAEEKVRDGKSGDVRPVTLGDIAILFRSRESHREFERALEAREIPAYVYKGLGFFDADEIKDLSALMRYLADPRSELRTAAFLRSRFVRLSDEALSKLAPQLSAAVLSGDPPAVIGALREADRRVLAQLRVSAPRWVALVDRVPPAELIDQVLAESAYAVELRGSQAIQARENVKKMRSLVRRIQNRGYATLARIADHVDRLSADESNAVVDARGAVSLMTVHAAKGLEFPVVFLVNLARGTGGLAQPIRVVRDRGDGEPSISVGPFVSEADEVEQVREREDTKRLLYVAMTRARDRLYLSSVLAAGELKPGRGSLAEVLPSSLQNVFADAARAPAAQALVTWAGQGRRYAFRVCRPQPPVAREAATAQRAVADLGAPVPGIDNVGALESRVGVPRMTVTACAAAWAGRAVPTETDDRADRSDLLAGTLVHRLLQVGGTEMGDLEQIKRRAAELLRPDEQARVADFEELVTQAAETYQAVRHREDIVSLMSGDCLYEVPFSLRLERPPDARGRPMNLESVIVRGTIDCLVRRPGDRLTVLEFKTGARRSEHQAQLDLYLTAARALFPGGAIDGTLVYA